MKNKDRAALDTVAIRAKEFAEATARVEQEAAEYMANQLREYRAGLSQAVFQARAEQHSVMDIARAMTHSGKTPNRNAVYAILDAQDVGWTREQETPFEWWPREVETAAGTKTVYDVHVTMSEGGPDRVSGTFYWRYDTASHELEPVLTGGEPYPYERGFYKNMLDRWLMNNPYPGEE